HGPDRQVTGESARDPEGHDPTLRYALRRTEPDERRPPEPPRYALLDGHRTGERQPVSVHAMLLALSLTEPAASYAAEGSKPEWIAQCSQRGWFPGPYSSHSMPSTSPSYAWKIPSLTTYHAPFHP